MNDARFILVTLVIARVAGLTMTAPIYGTSAVPLRVRVLLAAAIGLLVMPLQWNTAIACPGSVVEYLALLGVEAAIGASLGLGVLILIHGLTLAGELIGQASGLTLSDLLDPAFDQEFPLFSRLMFWVGLCVFVCLGGHRLVMAGLLDTFRAIPPGSGTFPNSLGEGFVTLVSLSFALGVRAAAAAVTALLLATLILGLIGRTLPQLNIFSMGFGLNAMLAFAALGLTLGTAVWAFQDQIEPAMQVIFDALQTPAPMGWMS